MLSDLEPEEQVGILDEVTRNYASYAGASVASCNWVNEGKAKIDPKKLELYVSRLKKSAAYGKVVGLGIRPKPHSTVVPYIRLDIDEKKGIHFNAVELSDSSKKLAAVLERSLSLKPGDRETLYLDYIKALQNRSPEFIWAWWSTGKALV
ncbi:hypothetical protein V8E55_006269 [Tylopilus felleus]|jgi:hypothetical protein